MLQHDRRPGGQTEREQSVRDAAAVPRRDPPRADHQDGDALGLHPGGRRGDLRAHVPEAGAAGGARAADDRFLRDQRPRERAEAG